jgi:sugar/nucleoside kinase (ribokinase family)
MSILVVGSVALDTVSTPFGHEEETLGGSASYFSTAASFFTDVNLLAVVGADFPQEHIDFLGSRNINLDGLQRTDGKTFRWTGKYEYDLNEAHTLDTQLNVLETFKPVLPQNYSDDEYIFLANIDPEIQLDALKQVKDPKLVACDTMNFWIEGKKDELINTLKHVDILLINEAEARELAQEPNLVKAAAHIGKTIRHALSH